jgi:HSP20 family protein
MTHVKFNNKPYERGFNSFVDELFTELPVLFKNGTGQSQWKGFVPVNIAETEKGYTLEVVAPGFEKTDFKVSLDQQILTISAEKKEEVKDDSENDRNKKLVRTEYNYRSFKRSFTLDEKIDASSIEAQYVNGVLALNLPKKETVKDSAKEINIK